MVGAGEESPLLKAVIRQLLVKTLWAGKECMEINDGAVVNWD
jgi:hypothetical protein